MADQLMPDRAPGLNAERVRRDNLGRVLRALHVAGPLSRSDLVARTTLDRSTIGGLVEDLARRGLVSESPGHGGSGSGGPGRPSSVVQARRDGIRVLAIDIRVDGIAAAIVGLGGHVHGRADAPSRSGAPSPEAAVETIRPAVRSLLAQAGGRSVIAAGVSVPGIVSKPDGIVELSLDLGWRRVALVELLAERLEPDLPVHLGNEADLAARAEHLRGAGAGVDDLLYISGSIGGGVVLGGQALTSEDGHPGEVGHLPVNPTGERCACGSYGCWRTEVGLEALLRRAGRHGGPDGATARLVRAAGAGDPGILAALETHGRWLGIGLAGLVNVLGPRRVILGGFLASIFPWTVDAVLEEIERRALETARAGLEVVPGALGDDAALLGAAELALEPVLADPTLVSAAEITPSG